MGTISKKINNIVINPLLTVFIFFIKGYQFIFRPFVGQHCRFYPTCSDYMIGVLKTQGFLKGFFLGIQRILKCHPWHAGGIDPIPESKIIK